MTDELTTARQIIQQLLDCPYPNDLFEIRRIVINDYGKDEEFAKEDLDDSYCTEEFCLSERQRWANVQERAKQFLKSEN